MYKPLIIVVIFALSFTACESIFQKKLYKMSVTFSNGETDTLCYKGTGVNYFILEKGDVKSSSRTILSGVRHFEILEIIDVSGMAKDDSTWPTHITLDKNFYK